MVPDCILHKNNNPKMYVQNENDNKKYKYLLYKYKQFKYRNMKERNKNGEIYRNKMIEGNQYNARLLSHDFICMWLSKKCIFYSYCIHILICSRCAKIMC